MIGHERSNDGSRGTNAFWVKSDCRAFLGSSFACPKLGDAFRTGVTKNRAVFRKTFRPQFLKFSLAIESVVFHIYQNTADDSMAKLNFEICGQKVFRNNAQNKRKNGALMV